MRALDFSQTSSGVTCAIRQQLQGAQRLKYLTAGVASGLSAALVTTIISPAVGLAVFTPFVLGNLAINQWDRSSEKPLKLSDELAQCAVDDAVLSLAYEHLQRQADTCPAFQRSCCQSSMEMVLGQIVTQCQNYQNYLRALGTVAAPGEGLDAAQIGKPFACMAHSTLAEDLAFLTAVLMAFDQEENRTANGQHHPYSEASLQLLQGFWQAQVSKSYGATAWRQGCQKVWRTVQRPWLGNRWRCGYRCATKLGANERVVFDARKLSKLARNPNNAAFVAALYDMTSVYLRQLQGKYQQAKNAVGGLVLRRSADLAAHEYDDQGRAAGAATKSECKLTQSECREMIAALAFNL